VIVPRARKHFTRHALLNEPAILNNEHALATTCDHAEIVCNQQQRRVFANVFKEIEDLRLHGNVERRCRLVCNQQVRSCEQGRCNHRALPHATRQLVRESTVLS